MVNPYAVLAGGGGLVEVSRVIVAEEGEPGVGVIGNIGENNLVVIILKSG